MSASWSMPPWNSPGSPSFGLASPLSSSFLIDRDPVGVYLKLSVDDSVRAVGTSDNVWDPRGRPPHPQRRGHPPHIDGVPDDPPRPGGADPGGAGETWKAVA